MHAFVCPARTLSRAEIRRRGWCRSPKLLLISAICEDNLPLSFPRLVRSEEKEIRKSSYLLLCSSGFYFVLSSRVAWQKIEDVKKTREEDTALAGFAICVIPNAGSKSYLLFVVVLNLDTSS